MAGSSQADAAASAIDNVPVVGPLFSAYVRLMGGLGIGPKEAAQERVAAAGRLGTIQTVVAQSQGYNPNAQPQYTGADYQKYPKPPPNWNEGVAAWEAMSRRRGWTNLPGQAAPPPKPPPISTPPINPNSPPWPTVEGPAGLLSWAFAAQWMWDNKGAWVKLIQSDPRRWNTRKRKQLKPSRLDPRLMRRSVAKKATPANTKPDAQLAELVAPTIFQPRARAPVAQRAPAVAKAPELRPPKAPELSVPTITASRLPTPAPTRSSATVPSSSSSLLSWLSSPLLGLLGRSGYQTRARPISNIISLVDPLTRPQTGALTSPLGAFAGVPSTADCSCSKKPGKKGRKKRRTICYEGSYRETATGTRKLRRQEVPCK